MRMDILGIRMNDGVPDAFGAYWYVEEVDGWAYPTLRQSFGDKSGQHGAAMLEALFGTRTISVTGVCKTPNAEVFWQNYNRLITLCSDFVTYRNFDVYESVPKRVMVMVGGELRLSIMTGHFTFELPLVAVDPFKYSLTTNTEALSSGQTKVITNVGNLPSYPTITTTGPVIHLKNVTTDQEFRASGLSGDTVINFKERTAYSDTVNNVFGKIDMSMSEWVTISPGLGDTFRNLGGVNMNITYRDTWS